MYMPSDVKHYSRVHIFIVTAYTIHVHAEWRKTLTPSTHIYYYSLCYTCTCRVAYNTNPEYTYLFLQLILYIYILSGVKH
jgi:hypothetical protein